MTDPMKKIAFTAWVLAIALVAGCAKPDEPRSGAGRPPAPGAATGNMLGNPGFETGDAAFAPWTMNVHADPEAFLFALETEVVHDGAYSVRIERRRDEPFANIVQHFRRKDLANRRLRLSAWLRGENLASPAYLHAIPYFSGGQRGVIGGPDQGLSGTFDWTRLEMDIQMPERVDALEVGVTTTGDGILWIDDVELVPLGD